MKYFFILILLAFHLNAQNQLENELLKTQVEKLKEDKKSLQKQVEELKKENNSIKQKLEIKQERKKIEERSILGRIERIEKLLEERYEETNNKISALNQLLQKRRVINVTVHKNNKRIELPRKSSVVMEQFGVDKKSPTSILLIQGTISGYEPHQGVTNQGWKYGNSPEVIAQGVTYAGGTHMRTFSTTAIISNHDTIGEQTLTFRYFTHHHNDGRPFVFYNPNKKDYSYLDQSVSAYVVWEIENTDQVEKK